MSVTPPRSVPSGGSRHGWPAAEPTLWNPNRSSAPLSSDGEAPSEPTVFPAADAGMGSRVLGSPGMSQL